MFRDVSWQGKRDKHDGKPDKCAAGIAMSFKKVANVVVMGPTSIQESGTGK